MHQIKRFHYLTKAGSYSSLLVVLLSAAHGIAMASTKAVVDFPTLPEVTTINNNTVTLSTDLYVYKCDDADCSTKTQLDDYGHVTNVHRWPKSSGGPGGTPPATWIFLSLTENLAQYFEFWQEVDTEWQSCILAIADDGSLAPTQTTCVGISQIAQPAAANVPHFSMSAAMFQNAESRSDPSPSNINALPARSLTFVNATSASKICLQTDSSFEHEACSGAKIIPQASPYVINASHLWEGLNSEVAQVVAYQTKPGEWVDTGRDKANLVYATNLEATIWPEQDQFTVGPTTIDVSLVNGFNVGVSLVPDRDTVCAIADTEGGKPYFVLYEADMPMAIFPKSAHATLNDVCPTENISPDSSGLDTGCYSSCSYAQKIHGINSDAADQACCAAQYHSVPACTLPPTLPYVQNIDSNSERVYSWAFEDWRGTFTCEASASFAFELINPPLNPPPGQ
ncbi:MAG: thaumatin family protein [Thiohalocapsa sp.]